jgi:tyrosyl-tRNA synthetase
MPDLTRNAVDVLPAGRLAEQLEEGRPLRVKLGIDPTTADIHLGHTVVLEKLAEFQRAGHQVVLIIGDFTALVGDPSGRSATRPVPSTEEIEANAATYQDQAFKILDREQTEVRRNSEWLRMEPEALLGLLAQTTVARLLERDDSRSRRWSCSTRCCRATTQSPWRPTSSSAAPTRSSTSSSGATSRAPTARSRSRS